MNGVPVQRRPSTTPGPVGASRRRASGRAPETCAFLTEPAPTGALPNRTTRNSASRTVGSKCARPRVAYRSEHSRGRRAKKPQRIMAPLGVMQPSAIGAGDDCCDRGPSRSSRALWRRAARQAAPGAHDRSPTGCDSRAHGVAVTAGGPEFGPPYDGRLLTDDRGLAASRLPDGRNGRSVAATFAAPVHRRSSASPRSYVNGIDALSMPERSGAAEGVGEGRRPARVQIDDSGRRGPFSGL